MPSISVLMPVHNAEKFLREAIDSILNQDFLDWELVIINDGSTDGSKMIVSEYGDKRIRYYENETNIGLIDTLNKGIDLCLGKYIARMDADDVAFSERLRLQYNFLENNPSVGLCGGNVILIDTDGKQQGKLNNVYTNDWLHINLLFSVPFVHPTILARKEVFDDFKFDKAFKHAEDYELWCRIAHKWELANIPAYLLRYRWHDTNVSVVNQEAQNTMKDGIIRRELLNFGIEASEQELILHKMTFQLYDKGRRKSVSVSTFDEIESWFAKLITQNKMQKQFDQKSLISFLWGRWAVLCVSQKKYLKLFFPKFASYSPLTLIKTTKFIYFLSKK